MTTLITAGGASGNIIRMTLPQRKKIFENVIFTAVLYLVLNFVHATLTQTVLT